MPYDLLTLIVLLAGGIFSGWYEEKAASPIQLSCDDVQAYLTENDSLNCCYRLSYTYTPGAELITALETRLLTGGASYSAVQYPIASGWTYESLQQGGYLRWHNIGGVPTGNQVLFDFCIAASQAVELEVNWIAGGTSICRDTLRLPCWSCLVPQEENLACLDEGGYLYSFSLDNQTGFDIHRLRLDAVSEPDLLEEVSLNLIAPWSPSTSRGGFSIKLKPEAEDMETFCFDIVASRLIGDSTAVECCIFSQCLSLPLCDRCCTPFEDYTDDVNTGFTVSADCETGFLRATFDRWGQCDRVFWNLRNLNTGTGIGGFVLTSTINLSFLSATPYQLCMRVERRDLAGMNCYGSTTLVYCDTLFFDCPPPPCIDSTLIGWDIPCPPVLDLVCGCDTMTYINACAANNWSGVLEWEEGPCGEPPVDSIFCKSLITISKRRCSNGLAADWWTIGTFWYSAVCQEMIGRPSGR
jgi:hypothetical protein